MLLLTDSAAAIIQTLVHRPELPETAGLRISADRDFSRNGPRALTVSTAVTPAEGDQVVEQEGARVFLEPGVDTMLDQVVLDASVDDDGRVQFQLGTQQ